MAPALRPDDTNGGEIRPSRDLYARKRRRALRLGARRLENKHLLFDKLVVLFHLFSILQLVQPILLQLLLQINYLSVVDYLAFYL